MQEKIQKFMKENGFDFIDSWQYETTGTVTELYRKDNEDIKIKFINHNDNL
jgi:hypothetical protein